MDIPNLLVNAGVSFVSGIGSSVVVGFFSNALTKRHERKKYDDQVKKGNNEIGKILETFISIDIVPHEVAVDSIIVVVSRQRGVSCDSLLTTRQAYQVLLIKMIQSLYHSNIEKQLYIGRVENAIQRLDQSGWGQKEWRSEGAQRGSKPRVKKPRSRAIFSLRALSVFIALVSAILTALITSAIMRRSSILVNNGIGNNDSQGTPIPVTGSDGSVLLALIAIVASFAVYIVLASVLRRFLEWRARKATWNKGDSS